MYRLKQIAEITGAVFAGIHDHEIQHYLNDSRSLFSTEAVMFVALKTSRDNGHRYIPGLIERGVRSFLIQSNEFDVGSYKNTEISFLIAKDTLNTLQTLAAYHRQRFYIPVIGITGSNGKTVVKEWLYQLLKNDYSICRSPRSFNSQVGVPLSVLKLRPSHNLAIFEAGISRTYEMEHLASVIRPTIGVFTSIGSAHDEGFSGREQKINEKMKLLSGSDTLIINGPERHEIKSELLERSVFVSSVKGADVTFSYSREILSITHKNEIHKLKLPFSDQASVNNIATCIAVMIQLGYQPEELALRIAGLQHVALRLELKKAVDNSVLVNDFYNSDLDSIVIALDFLQQKSRDLKKTVIISDVEQSGLSSSELYRELGRMISKFKIDQVIGIGREIGAHRGFFNKNSIFFSDTEEAAKLLRKIRDTVRDSAILIKGARSFGFEKISRLLQLKSHDTIFEINLNRLIANVNYYRTLVSRDTRMMCMVKAMGYGGGSEEISRTLQHIGADYLAVAYADEGVELRNAGIGLPILVMSPEEDAYDDIISFQLEPEIYSLRTLHSFVTRLDSMGVAEPFPVHIKIDTGMHRLGFAESEFETLVHELMNLPQIKVKSVFSHLASSEDPNMDAFTAEQIRIFEKAFIMFENSLGYKVIRHICNSAGISRFRNAHYDMVRLGIGMYGISEDPAEQVNLENAGSLRTRISQLKHIGKEETVGYGRSGKLSRDTMVATIPIGYADGFSRGAGNGNHGVYIRGKFCPTIGSICMDMCMIDVTGIACAEGDEAVIFETADQLRSLAVATGTIAYEILSNVSARVKRVYVQE